MAQKTVYLPTPVSGANPGQLNVLTLLIDLRIEYADDLREYEKRRLEFARSLPHATGIRPA